MEGAPIWQPTLEGVLVRARPLRAEDFGALYGVARDPAIWAQHPAHDRWREPVFRQFFADALDSSGALIVEDAATGAAIGSSRYDERRAGAGEVEIGWTFLARSHWGGAANGELKRLMLGHAFRHVGRVVFMVGEGNARSRRALEKIGAGLTGRTDDREMSGQIVRHLVYAIDRAAWPGAA